MKNTRVEFMTDAAEPATSFRLLDARRVTKSLLVVSRRRRT